MGNAQDLREEASQYFEPVIGAEIVAVSYDGESYWFHLRDGRAIEITATRPSGFEITLHP